MANLARSSSKNNDIIVPTVVAILEEETIVFEYNKDEAIWYVAPLPPQHKRTVPCLYSFDKNLRITHVKINVKKQTIEKIQVCLNVNETFNILDNFS